MHEAGALEDVRVGAACGSRAASTIEPGGVLIIANETRSCRELKSRANAKPKLEGDAAAVGRCKLVVR